MAKDFLEDMGGEYDGQTEKSPQTSPGKKIWNRFRIFGKYRKGKLLVPGCVLFVILAIGTWFFWFNPSVTDKTDIMEQSAAAKDQLEQGRIGTIFQEMDDIVFLKPFEKLSLKGTSTMAYVDMDIAIELIDPKDFNQLLSMEIRIHDIIQSQVMELTWLILRSPQGKIKLKYDLLKRINSLFPAPVVRNVYFTKFLMQ